MASGWRPDRPDDADPYILSRSYLINVEKGRLPYTKPPLGTLAAVNLKTGSLQFEAPLG
jgi:hypothetical protein